MDGPEALHEVGEVGDGYRRLTDLIDLQGAYAIVEGVVVFEDKPVRVVYRPGARPDDSVRGIKYLNGEGFTFDRVADAGRFRLDGYWVKNATPGQVATVIAQGLIEPVA